MRVYRGQQSLAPLPKEWNLLGLSANAEDPAYLETGLGFFRLIVKRVGGLSSFPAFATDIRS